MVSLDLINVSLSGRIGDQSCVLFLKQVQKHSVKQKKKLKNYSF